MTEPTTETGRPNDHILWEALDSAHMLKVGAITRENGIVLWSGSQRVYTSPPIEVALIPEGAVLVTAETLDAAMAAVGIHLDNARPGPTREVGCRSCANGIAAILARISEAQK
jgi:hypothetical protein